MSTADKVLDAIRAKGIELKQKSNGLYQGNSPRRNGSDSGSFVLKIDGPEHGVYTDHAGEHSGTLYELAQELGIELPALNNSTPHEQTSKRVYAGLADYAQAHGVEASVYEAAGWKETVYQGRAALEYPTANGPRYRFIDGKQPSYINIKGYVPCLYGLARALAIAKETDAPALILCNGEASTVVAQHYGLPAFATTRGEKQLADVLLDEIKDKYGKHLWIAFDCDETGRRAAKEVAAQYPDSTVIDLGLGDKGDLADLCTLHQTGVKAALLKLVDKAQQPIGTPSDVAMRRFIQRLSNPVITAGRPWRWPMPSFWAIGGFASVVMPKKIIGIVAPSGAGKTAMVETVTDLLLQNNLDVLFYGPEWSEDELTTRRVTRYGGITLEQEALDVLWHIEEADGIPEPMKQGKRISTEALDKSARIASGVAKWPGRVYCYENKPDAPVTSLESLLGYMADDIGLLRRKGRRPVVVVLDYAQLLKTEAQDTTVNRYELVVETIKKFAQDLDFNAIVTSQVTKQASKDQRHNNEAVKGDDALFLRDDKFNFFFTLNRDYDTDPQDPERSIELNTGYALVTKNSTGLPHGRVNLLPRLERHTWVDPIFKDKHT